jgi:hypothetical protein
LRLSRISLESACCRGVFVRLERGLDRVLGKVAKSFGEGPARRAGTKYGVELRDARDAGRLAMAAGSGTLGALGTKATRPVRPHTFHGDTPERP